MDESQQSKRNTRNVVVLSICQALFNSGRTLAFIAASLAAISMLGDDLTFVTAPITMMLVGTAAGTLPSAYLMRALGRKWGFFIGSVVGAIGSAVAAVAVGIDSFVLFNIGIFLFGVYGGAAQQYRFAAADFAPEHIKARSISLVVSMGVVGAFVGPETTLMTKDLFGWTPFEGTFWALMVFCLLAAVIVLGIDNPKLTKAEFDDSGRPLSQIVVVPTFIVALIAALFGYMVMSFLMTATPVTMRIEAFTDNNIARVIQWHVVGMFAPGFFTGSLIQRFGIVRIIVLGSALLLGSVVVALAGDSFAHFFTALFLLGVGWNFTFTGGTVLLTEVHTPSERAKVQGINDFILFSGLAISALSAGMIYHFFGWMWVNLATAPLILAVLLPAIWLRSVRGSSRMTTGRERDNRDSIRQARESFNTGLRSPDYERIHGDDEQLRALVGYLGAEPGGTYLDLATGGGYVAFALAEGCPDCLVVAVDIADEAIAANAERAAVRGLTNLEFRVVDGIHLPFADQAFDGVICRYAFHHFPEPQATLADVHRVLKPGGRLVVADAVKDEADTVDFINAFQALQQDGHVRMHVPDVLLRLLVDAGFEERRRHMTAITFPRRLNAAYRELLAKTPPAITDRYLLEVKGDEALVRFDVLNVALRKRP